MKTDGIDVHILGDFGPFSRTGKSIGYKVDIGDAAFLVDCGSPLFNALGGHSLAKISGLIITHCHDDHKRWFSDLALFHRYAPDIEKRIFLITSEDVLSELKESSSPSIDRSLSRDSKNVIDISFDEYVETMSIGPRAKYRIAGKTEGGTTRLFVSDSRGKEVGPDRAKIVISSKSGRPRMLFRDPESGEWVEPEAYYPFSTEIFYERNKRPYKGKGFTVEAIKAPVWHGIPGIGIRFSTGKETVFFTSDTVHDLELWRALYSEKRRRRRGLSLREFRDASVIHGDINDYVERIWSRRRYEEARKCFRDAVVIQDVSSNRSTVHTDYERLDKTLLKKGKTLLTHCPDRMTSEWALCYSGKSYKIKDGGFFEMAGGKRYLLNADIYHKENGRYFVGYRNKKGSHTVYRNGGSIRLPLKGSYVGNLGKPLFNIDLYEDVGGEYFPANDNPGYEYVKRNDGKVELVRFGKDGSSGKVLEGVRKTLAPPLK